MGDCKFCGEKAGFLRRTHRDCNDAHRDGRQRMLELVTEAAGQKGFNETELLANLNRLAGPAFVDDDGVRAILAEGWRQAVVDAGVSDGILTQVEENRLRTFRDQLDLDSMESAATAAGGELLDDAAYTRFFRRARRAAVATTDWEDRLQRLQTDLTNSGLSESNQHDLLVEAWEAAVESSLEDSVLSLDEEHALLRYLDHFDLSRFDVNDNGAHRNMIQSAMIREAAEGIIPDRLGDLGRRVPFNLMKSEQLVWLIDDVDYYEVITRRERRGSSHGVSIRVAKGLYYRPSTFKSRAIEWEETVRQDTGLLGITSKHIYFHGPKKRFRIRYDRIVSFEPYSDGLGVMREAQSAKPQTFSTGDGWFIYNLVTNLAQRW